MAVYRKKQPARRPVRRGASEVPLCAAMPQNVAIAGIDPADLIGIHTYCRDADIEVIDARYLRKV